VIRPAWLRWPLSRPLPARAPRVKATTSTGRALPVRYYRGRRRGWCAEVSYPGPAWDVTVSVGDVPAANVVTVRVGAP